MQISPSSPVKPGNAKYQALVGCATPFMDSESVYKPRTLFFVGKAWQIQKRQTPNIQKI